MARPTVSKPFLRQPTYPARIDSSHPIGRKVTAALSAHYGAAIRITEMVSGAQSTVSGGAINNVTANTIGKGFRPSTTSSGVYWTPTTLGPYGDGTQDFSIEFLITFLASDGQFSRLFDCGGTAGTGPGGGWDIETDVTGSGLNFVGWNNTTPTLNPLGAMTVGRSYHYVITQKSGTNAPVLYLNGQVIASTSLNVITPTSGTFFYSTYRAAGDLSCAGIGLHLARFYQGTSLTSIEVKRLYEKPFEMFRKPRRIFGYTAAAGVSGSAAWTETQDAITASGSVDVAGTAAWTEVQDSIAASGTVGNVAGGAAWTETQDSIAASGSVDVAGSAAWIEAQDSIAAQGTLGVFAAGAWTEIQDSIAAVGTLSLPSVTGDVAWVEAQDLWNGQGGDANADTHDPGITPAERKRLRKREEQRQKEFAAERAKREGRKAEVISAFERIIDGKPQLPDAVAEEIVAAIEAQAEPDTAQFDIAALVHDASRIQALWNEFIDRDDEEVFALL